jgi:hypothetical protein
MGIMGANLSKMETPEHVKVWQLLPMECLECQWNAMHVPQILGSKASMFDRQLPDRRVWYRMWFYHV